MILSIALMSTAIAAPVFVIEDGDEQMDDLITSLESKGHTVTRSTEFGFLEYEFTGTEIDLDEFDVVFWMDGRFAASEPMPDEGQEALLSYVRAGGGVVLFGQNGFNYAAGRHPSLEPLIPLRSWSLVDAGTFSPIDEEHPLCESFSDEDELDVTGGRLNVVSPVFGESYWEAKAGAAVRQGAVAYEEGEGRGVQWTLWGNAGAAIWQTDWSDDAVSQMLDNSIQWVGEGPPRPDAGGPYTGEAGGFVTLDASGSVPRGDAEIESYIWTVGETTFTTDEPTATFDATGIDGPAELDVLLTVVDSNGLERSEATVLVLDNADPILSSVTCDLFGNEGDELSFNVAVTDPEADDTLTVTWTVEGVVSAEGTETTIAFAQDGFYSIVALVEDDDGGTTVGGCSGSVTIDNVPPSIVGEPSGSVDAGGLYEFRPMVDDPGIEDIHVWAFDGPSGMTIDAESGELLWSPSIEDVGTTDVRIIVDDGRDSRMLEWELTVQYPDLDEDGARSDVDCDDADPALGSELDDSDCDGMTDDWEAEYGLDSDDAADALSDVDGDGRTALEEFVADTDPTIYEGPGTPNVSSPADGSEVNAGPVVLVVENADAPIDQELIYSFTLAMDPTLETMVTGTDDVVGSEDGTTSWTIDVDLVENAWYYWTARAEDEWTTGFAMDPVGFFVNFVNDPPLSPGINFPMDGDEADEFRLVADVPDDPDLDAVSIIFMLSLSDGTMIESPPIDGDAITADWSPTGVAVEDGETLCWSAIAVDEHWFEDSDDSLTSVSEESELSCFVLNRLNLPPSAPEIIEPTTRVVASLAPTFVVANGVDPEGRDTVHRFQIDGVDSFTSEDMLDEEIVSGTDGQTVWTSPIDFEENSEVWVRVACSDGAQSSDWTTISVLLSEENDPPGSPGLLNPADGATLTEEMALMVTNSEDPEGDPMTIEFQIRDLRDRTVAESGAVELGDGTTSWSPDALGDGQYQWAARAVDAAGAASAWTEPRSIIVGTAEVAEEPQLGGMVSDEKAEGCGCSNPSSKSSGTVGLLVALLALVQRRKTPRC